jgi:hypothetical protein
MVPARIGEMASKGTKKRQREDSGCGEGVTEADVIDVSLNLYPRGAYRREMMKDLVDMGVAENLDDADQCIDGYDDPERFAEATASWPRRVGTWNLDARATEAHVDFLQGLNCDVLLLTEVAPALQLPGYVRHLTRGVMARGQHWAGIFSKVALTPLPDPHGATAMAKICDISFCASILPWRTCGSKAPWVGTNTMEKTKDAVSAIVACQPAVWGGDWNHAFEGRERAGSIDGRAVIRRGADELGLLITTHASRHHLDGLASIDHIAVPRDWAGTRAQHVPAGSLSDHDAYVVERR